MKKTRKKISISFRIIDRFIHGFPHYTIHSRRRKQKDYIKRAYDSVKRYRSCCLRFDPSRYYGNSRTLQKKTLMTRTEEHDSGNEAGAAASSRFSSDRSSLTKLRELVVMLKNSMRDPQRSLLRACNYFLPKNSKVRVRAHRFERLED
jgi:hypothetical protein